MNKRMNTLLQRINALEDDMKQLSDTQLQNQTEKFCQRLQNGESKESILVEAYATIREASRRVLGLFAYDEQVLGAIALNDGNIAEMRTGEGKTLVATMPLYLNALTKESTILVTSNSYLAIRDAKEMGQVYNFLSLSVGIGVNEDPGYKFEVEEKQAIYASDIVYTTYGALTFDYLIENLVSSKKNRVLRPFYYVLIDEIDAVLLDAAQMPLVISGAPRAQSNLYTTADYFACTLVPEEDFEVEDEKSVWLTSSGIEKAKSFFNLEELYVEKYYDLIRHIVLALNAHTLYAKDKQYVVEEGKVKLIDGSTGRIIDGTKLRGGQHQAIEAKEHVELTLENRAMASITYQAFFRMFPILSGMSGVVSTDKKELKKVYDLDVITIPTHRPIRRVDLEDSIYTTRDAQLVDSFAWVQEYHEKGQPILIITDSIETSYQYSEMLLEAKIPHNVLNAYNLAKEAEIIAEAGQKGNVTVATSMAGRGTDIRLGEGVNELGGLVVLVVGLMKNIREELQARGRSGRQGDNGLTKCFISLDDDLIQELGKKFLLSYQDKDAEISIAKVDREIARIRKTTEDKARAVRKETTDFDVSLSKQRDTIYEIRNTILDKDTIHREDVERLALAQVKKKLSQPYTIQSLSRFVSDDLKYEFTGFEKKGLRMTKKKLYKQMRAIIQSQLEKQEQRIQNPTQIEQFYRVCMLRAIDQTWVEEVDYLHQLRVAMATRKSVTKNAVNTYHQEAYDCFNEMMRIIQEIIVKNVLLSVVSFDEDDQLNVLLP